MSETALISLSGRSLLGKAALFEIRMLFSYS